jgi:hypothetical protein
MCSCFLLVFAAVGANAQFKAGIQGTVTDETGALVSGANVTLTNKGTGKSQTATTSDEGFYRISGLGPGNYSLSVEKTGFKKQVIEDLTVNAEAVQGLDVKLVTGAPTETVTVSEGAAQPLETENATISKAITTQEVRELPQVGRDPYELVRLTPGVVGDGARGNNGLSIGIPNVTGPGGSNTSIFQVENQVQISANGQRVSTNNFLIDGVSVNSLGHGGAALITPNQESVKEVRVKSNTFSAEDGRSSGAQVQVVSQSGTNQYHGSAFFKYNDPSLNSFNKYGGPGNAPHVRVNQHFRQFGGSLGGPLYLPRFGEGGPSTYGGKDHLFFFISTESLRNNTNDVINDFVETAQFREQVISLRPGSVTSRILSSSGIQPRVIAPITVPCSAFSITPCAQVNGGLDIGSLTGASGTFTGTSGGGLDGIPDIQFAQLALPNRARGNQYNIRIDAVPNNNNNFAFSGYLTKRDDLQSDASSRSRPISDLGFKPVNSAATITWNHIFNNQMINEVRANATRFHFNQVEDSVDTNFGVPRIEIEGPGFNNIGRLKFDAPQGEATPGIFTQNIFEVSDTLRLTHGNHGLSGGIVVRREQDNNNLVGGARPVYSFVGLFNFANDAPVFEGINADPRTGATADIQRYFRTNYYAGFVQDDWKFRPNLTLNLGLRYEYYSPIDEKEGRLSNLTFGPPGRELTAATVGVVQQFFKPDRNNFAPRLGFAYSPKRMDDKLVLRGGFGISYNRIPNVVLANSRANPPFLVRFGLCCAFSPQDLINNGIVYTTGANRSPFSYPANPLLALGIDPTTGLPRGRNAEIYGAQADLPNAYVYSYSMEGEYILPFQKLVASVSYQGSAGHHLIRTVNLNFVFNPDFGKFFAVYFPLPDVNSSYNALIARLTRRFANGFQLDAVYRFSSSHDEASYEFGAETNETNPRDLRSEYGPSDFDVRHNLVVSGLWELPIFRNRHDAVGNLLGGWQITGILTTHSGYPWTAKTFASDLNRDGGGPDRPTAYNGGALNDTSNDAFIRPGGNFPGGGRAYFNIVNPGPPGVGRNSFRGPHYFSVDMSLTKRFAFPKTRLLGESANIELRANAFNVFNNLNLIPLRFFSPGTFVDNDFFFGRSEGGQAGRVIELQARFRF